jgi:hypothetical protein
MADFTDNYNLKLPEKGEYYNIEDFNGNAKIVDKEIFKLHNKGYYFIAVSGFDGDKSQYNSSDKFVSSADKVLKGVNMQDDLSDYISSVPEGSILLFAPGGYFFSSAVKVNKRITLAGMNKGVAFYGSSQTGYILNIGNSDDSELNFVSVKNIYFVQNEDVSHEKGMIYASNVNGLKIADCAFAFKNKDTDDEHIAFIHLSGQVINAVFEANMYGTSISGLSGETQKWTVNGEELTASTTLVMGVAWTGVYIYDPNNKMSVNSYGIRTCEKVTE